MYRNHSLIARKASKNGTSISEEQQQFLVHVGVSLSVFCIPLLFTQIWVPGTHKQHIEIVVKKHWSLEPKFAHRFC